MTRIGEPLEPQARRPWSMRKLRLRRRHRRRLPPVSVIPTLCTLGNLIAGFAAIHYAAREPSVRLLWHDWTPLVLAGALIFVGMFLDAIDGSLARLMGSNSGLGAQLDSLADVVTFGVAPAFMTLRLVSNHLQDGIVIGPEADDVFGKIIWLTAAVYVSCAALRLARFNVEMGPGTVNDHSLFRGLPSPGAAGTVTSMIILHQYMLVHQDTLVKWFGNDAPAAFVKGAAFGIPFVMLLCGVAMVSSIPYVHFANRYFRGRRSFAYVVRIVLILTLTVLWFQGMLALGFTVYALSGPVRMMWQKMRKSRLPAPTATA